MKTEHIVVKATKNFKKRVKKVAGNDNKNVSEYVRDLILEDFKKRDAANISKALST